MGTDLENVNPFETGAVEDPYSWLERLRRRGTVVRVESPDIWVVVGYDELVSVVRDPAAFSSNLGYKAMGDGALRPGGAPANAFGDVETTSVRMLISTDPPEHTRVRRLLSRAFTPRAITDLEPRLREVCDEMVDDLVAKARTGEADLVRDLAAPFPVTVIAELLDVPVERRADFRRWSDALSGGLSGSDADMDAVASAGLELFTFMTDVVERRRVEPGPDLISRLIRGTDAEDEEPLNLEEITLIAILLLVAGNETTTNLIGNAANAFATHPEQAAQVWADPSLLPGAIEEVLRWDSPVQAMVRGTTAPVTVGGVDIPGQAVVLISFAGANNDPAKFPDPRRFDIRRGSSDHMTFGHGIHFCLGAALARAEARLAFETLIDRGVEIPVSPAATRTTELLLRGFTSYPL